MISGVRAHDVKCLVLFLMEFPIPFLLLIGLVELINSSISVAQVSSQTLLQGFLFVPLSKSGIITVRHIIMLRYSSLILYHTVALGSSIIGGLTLYIILLGLQYASPVLPLAQHLWSCAAIRIHCYNLLSRESLVFVSGILHGVFILQGVQEVSPVFLDKRKIVHIFVLHIVTCECWEAILC